MRASPILTPHLPSPHLLPSPPSAMPDSLDKLKQAGCCHIYSARDYTMEGSGGSDDRSDGGAHFARSKVDPLLAPPSPAAMAR